MRIVILNRKYKEYKWRTQKLILKMMTFILFLLE